MAVQSCRLKCLNVIVNYFSDLQKHTITIVVLTQGVSDVVQYLYAQLSHTDTTTVDVYTANRKGQGKTEWEVIPPVVDFSSLACFKRTIINVDFTEFLKG